MEKRSPNPPRKHHFVQAEHLRQFEGENGVLFVFAKDGRYFPMTAESIFIKKDLNSFDTPEGVDTSFEDVVTLLENEHWPSAKAVIERGSLCDSDINGLTWYMALSRLRNPSSQAGIIEQRRKFVETSAKILDGIGKFSDLGRNPIDPSMSLTELLESGAVEIKINNSEFLRSIWVALEQVQSVLENGFRWSLVKSPRSRVIISDHPFTYLHPESEPTAYGIPMGGNGCEIAFPLSQSIYLFGAWGRKFDPSDSEDAVDELNKRQAAFANRQIASSQNNRALRSLALRYKNYGFQTLSDEIPTPDGAYHIVRAGLFALPGVKSIKLHPIGSMRKMSRFVAFCDTNERA